MVLPHFNVPVIPLGITVRSTIPGCREKLCVYFFFGSCCNFVILAEYSVLVQGKSAGYFHSKSWVIEVHSTRWLCILIMLWIIKGLLYFPLSSFLYSSSPHQQINAECLGICPAQTLAHYIFSLETFCSGPFELVGFHHLLLATACGLNDARGCASLGTGALAQS